MQKYVLDAATIFLSLSANIIAVPVAECFVPPALDFKKPYRCLVTIHPHACVGFVITMISLIPKALKTMKTIKTMTTTGTKMTPSLATLLQPLQPLPWPKKELLLATPTPTAPPL